MPHSTALVLLFLVAVASAMGQPAPYQPGEKVAPDVAPKIYLARASVDEVGEVTVLVTWRSPRIGGGIEGKPKRGWVNVWEEVKPLPLGSVVQAYGRDGKLLSRETVLKALAKQRAVVCFVFPEDASEKLDPLYLEMFREDVVVLAFKGADTRP